MQHKVKVAVPTFFGTHEVTPANTDLRQSWNFYPHPLTTRTEPELVIRCCFKCSDDETETKPANRQKQTSVLR